MKKVAGRRLYSAIHSADVALSFALVVGLALGGIVVAGIGRIVGWGTCP